MKYLILISLLSFSIAGYSQDSDKKTQDSERKRASNSKTPENQKEVIPKYDDATKIKPIEPEEIPIEKEDFATTEEELLKEIDRETMERIEKDLEESMNRNIKDTPMEIEAMEDEEIADINTQSADEPVEVKEYHHYYHNSKDKNKVHTMSGNRGHSGGYGALLFKVTEFNETSVMMTGFRAMWVVNRAFGIGVEGNAIIPVSKFESIDPEGINEALLLGGYGGLSLEPVFWSNSVIHFTFPVSFGGGWLGYIEDWSDNYYYYNADLYDHDVFYYIEPGANVEFNVARFFRIDLGVSKRYTYDLNLYNTPIEAFDNWNYTFTMKFGGF